VPNDTPALIVVDAIGSEVDQRATPDAPSGRRRFSFPAESGTRYRLTARTSQAPQL